MSTRQRRLARLNRTVGNRMVGRLLPLMPGFGAVVHRGRKSGKVYRTPVKLFRAAGGDYVISLPYGPDSDWVKNVIAANGCELRTRGRKVTLVGPRVFVDREHSVVPAPLRPILNRVGAFDFLAMSPAPAALPRAA